MRLVIDARMLDHSGIGTYLANTLPGVLTRCVALNPVILALPEQLTRAAALARTSAEVLAWPAPPLSVAEWKSAPVGATGDLWWAPHFNVPLRPNLPLVVTLHDLLPLNEAAGRWPMHKRGVMHGWLAIIRRRARRVICVSEYTRHEAIELGHLDPGKISVIPLGVDARWATGANPPVAGTLPYLLFVGLVKPHKNLGGLLRAFEAIASMIPHRLIVVGRHTGLRGIDTAALALAERLGPRVELLENAPQSRLADLVSGADLLIQPSLHEGFGLPPLEAMAAGTPVLAARAGALPEVCGEAALYFDPGSPADIGGRILEALGDDALRARLRKRGLERARSFTWDACATATAAVLLAASTGAATRGRVW